MYMVPDTRYLCASKICCSFPVHVSEKVGEDICSATTPLPHTTCVDSAEGFATDLCKYVCTYYTILRIDRDFRLC